MAMDFAQASADTQVKGESRSVSTSIERLNVCNGRLSMLADVAGKIAVRLSGPRPEPAVGGETAREPRGLVDALEERGASMQTQLDRLERALHEIDNRIGQ